MIDSLDSLYTTWIWVSSKELEWLCCGQDTFKTLGTQRGPILLGMICPSDPTKTINVLMKGWSLWSSRLKKSIRPQNSGTNFCLPRNPKSIWKINTSTKHPFFITQIKMNKKIIKNWKRFSNPYNISTSLKKNINKLYYNFFPFISFFPLYTETIREKFTASLFNRHVRCDQLTTIWTMSQHTFTITQGVGDAGVK